jgi:hypothetical protein
MYQVIVTRTECVSVDGMSRSAYYKLPATCSVCPAAGLMIKKAVPADSAGHAQRHQGSLSRCCMQSFAMLALCACMPVVLALVLLLLLLQGYLHPDVCTDTLPAWHLENHCLRLSALPGRAFVQNQLRIFLIKLLPIVCGTNELSKRLERLWRD